MPTIQNMLWGKRLNQVNFAVLPFKGSELSEIYLTPKGEEEQAFCEAFDLWRCAGTA